MPYLLNFRNHSTTLFNHSMPIYPLIKAMIGFMERDGMEWNGIEPCSIVWFGKKRMEWNVMEPIPSNTTHSSNFPFLQFGVYPKEWNTLIIQLQFCHFCFFLFLFHYSCLVPLFHYILNAKTWLVS